MSTMPEGLLSQLEQRVVPQGPEWLVRMKNEAARNLEEHGLPTKKHEAWRFTSVRDVVDTAFERAQPERAPVEHPWLEALRRDADQATIIWIVDGSPRSIGPVLAAQESGVEPHLSGGSSGVELNDIASQLRVQPSLLEPVLGRIARTDHFAALNAALFTDGQMIRLGPGARPQAPIHVVHVSTSCERPAASYPRLVVIAEPESEAILVETYVVAGSGGAKRLTNAVTEVDVREGARLTHVRVVLGAENAFHLAHLAVRQGRDSFYGSRVVTLGGALSRLDLDLHFAGEGAEAELDGVYHVDGREHVDHHLRVVHEAGRCTSHVRYRGLLDGKGHAVFDAIGIVEKNAAGSSVHQENRNLLLSDDATIDTKPHLEIETDEVSASHGTAVGAVDETQLFYLRARGIPDAEARDVLTFAFVRAILDRIPHEPTRARASEALLARLPSGARIREMST